MPSPDNFVSLSDQATYDGTVAHYRQSLWADPTAASGDTTITVTLSGTTNLEGAVVYVYEIPNVTSVELDQSSVTGVGYGESKSSGNVSPRVASEIMFGAAQGSSNATLTGPANPWQDDWAEASATYAAIAGYQITSSLPSLPNTYAYTATAGSSEYGNAGIYTLVCDTTLTTSADNFTSLYDHAAEDSGSTYYRQSVWADPNAASGQSWVAVTLSGTTNLEGAVVYVYEIPNSGGITLDQSHQATASYGTSISSGSTSTTSVANEILFGVAQSGHSAALTGPANPWQNDWAEASATYSVIAAYQVVSSESTYSYAPTANSNGYGDASIVTLEVAPPVLPPAGSSLFLPGPTWLKHFKPWLPKPAPLTQPLFSTNVVSQGSMAMAVLAYGYGFVQATSPADDVVNIRPGPAWLSHFKPGLRPRPPLAAAPPSNPYFGQLPNYTDLGPNIKPGPTWLAHFKPWLKRPVVAPPPAGGPQNPGSVLMAPYGMSGAMTVYPTGTGRTSMERLAFGGSYVHVPIIGNAAMVMAPYLYGAGNYVHVPVLTSGSMAMGAMHVVTPAFLADQPHIKPGPTWISHFKPWSNYSKLKIPGGPSFIGVRGSVTMAPMGIAATASSNAPFPQYPLSIKIELLINGTWIDVTRFVYNRDGIVITRGLPDETQAATPAQMTLTLNNRDGRFSPNNPTGAYYPYLTRNTQCRMSVADSASSTAITYQGFRFWGEISNFPVRWDSSQSDIYCQVVVSGPLRRFVQGAKLGSTLYQYYSSLGGEFAPYAYWPCEDASQATEIASALPSVPSMSFTGAPQFASNAAFGGSDPLPVIAASTWYGVTAAAADPPGTGSLNQISPGTYYWVCPPGVTAVTGVICTGAGGGGGDQNSSVGGGGGGGGGVDQNASVAVTAGNRYYYTIGAGGTTTSTSGGGTGGNSTFTGDSVTVTGVGGGGGSYAGSGGAGGSGNTYFGGAGAAGSASSGGSFNDFISGSYGASGGGADGGQTTTSWTAPGNITGSVSYSTEGGGGGGGAAAELASSVGGGGGGGGGGLSSGSVSASGGQSFNISAGNGGSGSSPNGGHGGTGGESDFDGNGSASGGSGGLEGGGNPAGGAGGSPSGGTGGEGGGLIAIGGGNNTSHGGSGGSPNGGSGGQATVISGTGYEYYGNGGGGGSVSWSWNTSDAPVGGGGGSSAGTSTAGNPGSGTTGGSAPAGGGNGGSCGSTPAGSSPGGGGAGANPAGSDSATSPGAGAAGRVGFAWSGGATSPVAADIIRFCLDCDSAGSVDGAVLLQAITYGTCQTLNLVYHTGGSLELIGYNASSSVLFDSGTVGFSADGQPLYVDIELSQNGTSANWLLQAIEPGADSVVASASGTAANVSVGNVSDIYVDPAGAISDNATSIGQITVQTYADTLVNISPIVNGYAGELAATRMSRLCAAQGIGFTLVGNASDTPMMGPQQDDTFVNVMQSCSDFDRGQLYETRDSFGMGYRTRVNLQNQNPAVIINYAAAQLSGSLQPNADDQFTRNDITLTRNGGASSRQFLSSGVMSILAPPNGVGDYTYALTVEALSDTQLVNLVAWMLTVGTVSEYRYPTIEFDMARVEVANLFNSIPALDIGDYIQVYNQPNFLQNTPINQLFWGVTETLNTYTWTLSINTVPESPYTGNSLPSW